MKKSQLIILGIVALAAVGAAYLTRQASQPSSVATTGAGQKVFPSFPLNDVAEIIVTSTSGTASVRRTDNGWVVPQRANYPANFDSISSGLRSVWEMTTAQSVTAGPSQMPRLGLVKPADAEPNKPHGTLLKFLGADGKELAWLLLGKEVQRESAQPMMMNFGGVGRYLMSSAMPGRAWVINDTLSQFAERPADWLDKAFFSVSSLKSIEVEEDGKPKWKAERIEATADIQIVPSGTKENYDPDKVRPLGNVLSFVNFNDVAGKAGENPDPATGLDKPTVATLETFDGFRYKLAIGAATPQNERHVRVQVEGSFKTEREAAKDEKPEDKEQLDKQHAEKLKQLKEKLAREKKLEDWIYLVAEGSLESLLKDRKDFFKETAENEKDQNGKDKSKSDS